VLKLDIKRWSERLSTFVEPRPPRSFSGKGELWDRGIATKLPVTRECGRRIYRECKHRMYMYIICLVKVACGNKCILVLTNENEVGHTLSEIGY